MNVFTATHHLIADHTFYINRRIVTPIKSATQYHKHSYSKVGARIFCQERKAVLTYYLVLREIRKCPSCKPLKRHQLNCRSYHISSYVFLDYDSTSNNFNSRITIYLIKLFQQSKHYLNPDPLQRPSPMLKSNELSLIQSRSYNKRIDIND